MATRRFTARALERPDPGPIGRVVSPADGFVDWCRELLAPLGAVRAKAMFGGHGLYVDERFVAIVASEVLYLKADRVSAPDFAAAGSTPFTFVSQGRTVTMRYWRAPDDAMESPTAMLPWARRAVDAARRAAAPAVRAASGTRPPASKAPGGRHKRR